MRTTLVVTSDNVLEATPLSEDSDLRAWLPQIIVLLLFILAYLPTIQGLVSEWWKYSSYAHGFVVPVLSGYLLWLRRNELVNCQAGASLFGLIPFLTGIVLLMVGEKGEEEILARVSLPITLAGLIQFLFGSQVAKVTLAPVGSLLFMIPLPYTLSRGIGAQLQLLDAKLAARILAALGIPAFQNGVLLELPTITLEVAYFCSGIQSLAAFAPLSFMYVHQLKLPQRWKWPLYLAAIPISVLANVVRIVITAALAYYFGGSWALSFPVHSFTGSFNFLMAFATLVAISLMVVRVVSGRQRI